MAAKTAWLKKITRIYIVMRYKEKKISEKKNTKMTQFLYNKKLYLQQV